MAVEEERSLQEKEQARFDAIRMALLTSDPSLARGLLPEYFEPEEVVIGDDDHTDISLDRPDTNYDLSDVTWQSPMDMDPSQLDMLETLLADKDITVPGSPTPEEGVETDLVIPLVPDDPEWT